MTTHDYRKLCAELILSWDANGCDWKPQHQARWEATLARARAALAEGEAGPSDEEIGEFFQPGANLSLHCESGTDWSELLMDKDEFLVAVRAFLARYSAPRPIPVAERLPGAEDCDSEGRCWFFFFSSEHNRATWCLEDRTYGCNTGFFTHWLPAHALPIPENADD